MLFLFFIRAAEDAHLTGKHGQLQPFLTMLSTSPKILHGTKQGGFWENTVGIKERLLCHDCEQKFQKNETYVRNLLYGNASQPLQKIKIGDFLDGIRSSEVEDLIEARKANVDYKRLKLFQMSILWRAGIAQGPFFKEVNLGDFHEEKLRKLLDTENPGLATEYPCTMFDLRLNGNGCEAGIGQPRRSMGNHQRNYLFIMGGYAYSFIVSKQIPRPGAQLCCVKPSGEMTILVRDAKQLFRPWAVAFHKAGQI